MPLSRSVLVAGLALVAAGCRPSTAPAPARISSGTDRALRAFIDSMADAPEFSNAHWGILIVDPERGDTLYSRNAGKLFMPASNMKLPTSATALTQLGPDFRYQTSFVGRGAVGDSIIVGDLVIVGRGDPSVSDHMLTDAMAPLRLIADSIAARGIRLILGRVLPADDAFPGNNFGYGWTYDDFQDSYSAPIDELLFNEGFSVAHVTGGSAPGAVATVAVSPASKVPNVVSTVTTVARTSDTTSTTQLTSRKDSTTWTEHLTGQIAVGDTASIELVHHDPGLAYAAAFEQALTERGVRVAHNDFPPLLERHTLAVLSSPPLRDILPALLKPSQNQIAEMLFRTLALERYGQGRPDSAAAIVRAQLAEWGVAPNEHVIRDGSGLSRYDYLAPRTVVRILDAMRTSPNFRVFYDALPVAGVDGTIRNRMKGTPAEGNVHAKTGSVALSRSLSGYATTANGRLLVFSFLSNNWTVPVREVERVQDAIAARLAGMRR